MSPNLINEQYHEHINYEKINRKGLLIAIIINILITISQFIGGYLSKSLILTTDAIHNFTDVLSFIISYFAITISRKRPDEKGTFGYKRAEILAAFINSLVLVFISINLIYSAIERFFDLKTANGLYIIIFSTIGALGNFLSMIVLKLQEKDNLNIKSTYLHLLSDLLVSFVVIISGIVLYFFKFSLIDPIITIIISIYIIYKTIEYLKQSGRILIDLAPKDVDIKKIKKELLKKFDPIKNLHYTHVRQFDEKNYFFESHIEFKEEISFEDAYLIIIEIKKTLKEEFKCSHATLEMHLNNVCALR